MKKILALALAMIMTLGLASVAFAAAPEIWVEADSALYDEDGVKVDDFDGVATPDSEYYVKVVSAAEPNGLTDKDMLKGYRVFFDAKVGKLAADPEIVFVKLKEEKDAQGEYFYAVKLVTPDVTTKAYDLAGDLKIAKTASAAKDVANVYEVNFEVKFGTTPAEDTYVSKNAPIVTFDNVDDVVDLEDANSAIFLFTVNGAGQSDVNMKYSTKFDSSFAAKYDYANIDFVKFTKSPVFNRTGDLYIYADEDTYIYEVTADGAKEIANAEYDEDYGAWHIRTRSLKAYAISDSELKATESASSTPAESTGSSTGSTGKPNPGTGR